jgi:hypothetical protein
MDPDPVPRYRLVRDVLLLSEEDERLKAARADIDTSQHVKKLAESQWDDGTWGRFHTEDTKTKRPFPTTEIAVARALSLGLDGEHPILEALHPTLVAYVEGRSIWRDTPEKHDNPDAWPIWVRHFSAGLLAAIDPADPVLVDCFEERARATAMAFARSGYDRDEEIRALGEILGLPMRNPVPFHVLPAVRLLSARVGDLAPGLEEKILAWLWDESNGIYYLSNVRPSVLPHFDERSFVQWFRSQELLSRFDCWRDVGAQALDWIWSQRNGDGLWDLGRGKSGSVHSPFPLSESWRRPLNRVIDSTVAVLSLLNRGAGT